MSENAKDDSAPITTDALIKWGGFLAGAATGIVTIVWCIAGLKGDVIELRGELASQKSEYQTYIVNNDKRSNSIEAKADATSKSVADIESKLDVAVTLLTRIDKKVGQP